MNTTKPLAVVVEDHADMAEIFVKALNAAGFATMVIGNGLEALQRLPELRPSLIALDLQLPRVSGERILEQIRADERMIGTRVILVTAEQQAASHLTQKVDLVLLKPVAFDQLRDLAERMRSGSIAERGAD